MATFHYLLNNFIGKIHGHGMGQEVVRCSQPPPQLVPPFEDFALFIYLKNLNILNFFNETIRYFQNKFSRISSISGSSNVINGSKNIKCCEFCVNLNIFTVALFIVCHMTQCIVLTMQFFYLRRNKGPSVLLSTRYKRVVIISHKNQRLNIGNQYHKDANR